MARRLRMPKTVVSALLLALTALHTPQARADANGRLAAAMGLTAADGSVRTQAGVRLAISTLPGAPDRVMAMGPAIQARMPAVRTCFAEAMSRSSNVEGALEIDVEGARGRARTKLASDTTGDPMLATCIRTALSEASLGSVAKGARARVKITLDNPLAALRREVAARPATAQIRMLSGGKAESAGGTNDIRFRVSGSAYAAPAIAHIAGDMSTRIAGLLDCRRKAFRRERESSGSITLDLTLRHGTLNTSEPRASVKASASRCVSAWITGLDAKSLADADLELAVSFQAAR